MELFNIENPYFERWKPGRPSNFARKKRAAYWQWEKDTPLREKEERLRKACEKSIKKQGDVPHCTESK